MVAFLNFPKKKKSLRKGSNLNCCTDSYTAGTSVEYLDQRPFKYLRRLILLPAPKATELEWSHNPEIYVGGSLAVCRASHAGLVKGDDAD
jgi:hypothetical protein